jgi:hypothetical protein
MVMVQFLCYSAPTCALGGKCSIKEIGKMLSISAMTGEW